MKKDSFYFPHDSNAKDDPKCMLLIDQLGLEGYGIYWVLVEMLREQPDYRCPMKLVPVLAKRYNTSAEKMKTVISSYDLFVVENDEFFFSESLINRMVPMDEKKKQLRLNAESRWKKSQLIENKEDNANAMQMQCKCNANAGIKEKKRAEQIKEENTELPPLSPPSESKNGSDEEEDKKNLSKLLAYCRRYSASDSQIVEISRLTCLGAPDSPVWGMFDWMETHSGHSISDVINTLVKLEKQGKIKPESKERFHAEEKLKKIVSPSDFVVIMKSVKDFAILSNLIKNVEESNGRIRMPGKYIIKNLNLT